MHIKRISQIAILLQGLIFAKDGFFIGAEMQLGSTHAQQTACGERCTTSTPSINEYIHINSTQTSFDAGLLLGYQVFFDSNKFNGLKASFHLYGGTGEKLSTKAHMFYFFETNYTPIKTGIDLSYIFNFYNQENHKLGLGVGIGYEADIYLSSNGKYSNTFGETTNLKTRNLLAHGIYPTIGLYYILKQHHKFEINYRYNGLIKQSNPSNSVIISPSAEKQKLDPITHKLQYNNYFVLSYSYIF